MLTSEQLEHFRTFGFIVLRQGFSPEEMELFSSMFDEMLAEDRQGKPFPGKKRQALFGFIEKRAALRKLAEDDRIYEAIEQYLGPGFAWIGSAGNLYVDDTGWHPDGSEMNYLRIKVVFYLDSVAKDTGCLRVIPGSHKPPLHDDLNPLKDQRADASLSPFSISPRDVPCFPLESEPGDVVFFDQNLWHASFGGRTGRRMFTLNFGAKPTEDEHFAYLQRGYENNKVFAKEMQATPRDRFHEDSFLYSDRPRIQGMVKPILELELK